MISRKFLFSKKEECGKTRNSLPRKFFSSNQLTAKFYSKTLIWRKFCEKTVTVKFRNFHCGKNATSLAKELLSRNFCEKSVCTKLIDFTEIFLPAEKFQQLTKCFKKSVNLASNEIIWKQNPTMRHTWWWYWWRRLEEISWVAPLDGKTCSSICVFCKNDFVLLLYFITRVSHNFDFLSIDKEKSAA